MPDLLLEGDTNERLTMASNKFMAVRRYFVHTPEAQHSHDVFR